MSSMASEIRYVFPKVPWILMYGSAFSRASVILKTHTHDFLFQHASHSQTLFRSTTNLRLCDRITSGLNRWDFIPFFVFSFEVYGVNTRYSSNEHMTICFRVLVFGSSPFCFNDAVRSLWHGRIHRSVVRTRVSTEEIRHEENQTF